MVRLCTERFQTYQTLKTTFSQEKYLTINISKVKDLTWHNLYLATETVGILEKDPKTDYADCVMNVLWSPSNTSSIFECDFIKVLVEC